MICTVAIALFLCSCSKTQTVNEATTKPVKINDYLYEITCNKYCDTIPDVSHMAVAAEFGCSAVRNGNFYGRNLDYFVNEVAEFVVHTPATDKHHATLGICRMDGKTGKDIEAGLSEKELSLMPWAMFDGINDAGLFCNMNVVPAIDRGVFTGTNPGKPSIASMLLVRALLDNCANVDEALAYINNHNILPFDKGGYDLHFMIGDKDNTVVVEFNENRAIITLNQNIMTNFLTFSLPVYTPHADGIERYNILKEHYNEATSMEGMWNLMKRVRYSQAYDPETTPFWTTEFLGEKYTIDTPKEVVLADPGIKKAIENFKIFKETGKYTEEMGLWHTTHNSVYDIENRKLWITVREDYDHRYEYQLGK